MIAWTGNRKDKELKEKEEKQGYLTYRTLADYVGDMILCNSIDRLYNNVLYSGSEEEFYDEDGNEIDYKEYEERESNGENVEIRPKDYFQYYIISDSGAEWLKENTDEVVFYNNELDIYFWAITHCGTSWNYVFSNVKCVNEEEFIKQF